jgi:hypothetical protein
MREVQLSATNSHVKWGMRPRAWLKKASDQPVEVCTWSLASACRVAVTSAMPNEGRSVQEASRAVSTIRAVCRRTACDAWRRQETLNGTVIFSWYVAYSRKQRENGCFLLRA